MFQYHNQFKNDDLLYKSQTKAGSYKSTTRTYEYQGYKYFGNVPEKLTIDELIEMEYEIYYLKDLIKFEHFAETNVLLYMHTFRLYRGMTKKRLEIGAEILKLASQMQESYNEKTKNTQQE